jgi:hypothetical protein
MYSELLERWSLCRQNDLFVFHFSRDSNDKTLPADFNIH